MRTLNPLALAALAALAFGTGCPPTNPPAADDKGYDIKGTFDATELTGRGKLVGMHKYDNATLFIRDARITVDHASVRDVLPTACKLMDLDCPDDVDGRVVIE